MIGLLALKSLYKENVVKTNQSVNILGAEGYIEK